MALTGEYASIDLRDDRTEEVYSAPDDLEIVPDAPPAESASPYHPPSELLLGAASAAVWLAFALVARELVVRRTARPS